MNVYTLYRNHNTHFVIYGAMFAGQYGAAMQAAEAPRNRRRFRNGDFT